MKVLTPDFQSSEESGDDDTIIAVRPLPWRSDRVSMKFNELDKKTDASKTPQARRQKRRRIIELTILHTACQRMYPSGHCANLS